MSRYRTTAIINDVLLGLGTAGALTTTLVAPNLSGYLSKSLEKRLSRTERDKELARILRYMRDQKLIDVHELKDGNVQVNITDKGRERAHKFYVESMQIEKPKQWDEKWRLVIFDIPESKRSARDAFREKITDLGFQMMQHSVWVHPFPCFEEITAIKELYGVGPYVTFLEADTVNAHNRLVRRFAHILP